MPERRLNEANSQTVLRPDDSTVFTTEIAAQSRKCEASVCAVIVTRNPDHDIGQNSSAVALQVDKVVLIDNASSTKSKSNLEKLSGRSVARSPTNLGIAAALNIGVKYACANGFEFVLTLDQDSTIQPGFVETALRAYLESPNHSQIAIVASIYLDRQSGSILPKQRDRDGEILTTMTSGCFSPISVFQSVGLFDESLYMDYVDIEFCLRCRKAGFRIIESSTWVPGKNVHNHEPQSRQALLHHAESGAVARAVLEGALMGHTRDACHLTRDHQDCSRRTRPGAETEEHRKRNFQLLYRKNEKEDRAIELSLKPVKNS